MNLVLVRAGIRTADVLLAQFYGLAPLEKAGPDPLTPRGFDRVVLGVLRELRAGVAGKEKKAIEALLRELEGKDWTKLGEAARDKAFRDAAEKYLGFGPDVGAAVGQVARHVGPTIIAGTKVAAIQRDRLRIEPSLNAVDERMVVAAATHQALFARDEHGRRSAWLSDRARAVVSQGLEEGLDRYEIAKRIRSDIGAAADVRSENYWRLIASVFTGRARTYGHLSAMGESGIEEFEFEAVLDEVTTDICRFMHGKVFSTGASLARFSQVESATDPEEVKDLQPWASTGKVEDGSKAIFYKAGGARSMIARVDESAVGRKDEVGRYSAGMKRGALEKAGLTTPPLHGHCRSTTLPVLGAVQVLPGGPGQEALGAPLPAGSVPAIAFDKFGLVEAGKKDGQEHAVLVAPDGTILGRAVGTDGGSVDVPPSLLLEKDGSNLALHHNHPDSSALSYDDIRILATKPGLGSVVAYGHNGDVHTIAAVAGKRADLYTRAGELQIKGREKLLDKFFGNADPTPELRAAFKEALKELAGENLRALDAEGLLKYKFKKAAPEKVPAKPKKPAKPIPLGTVVPEPEIRVKKPPKKPGDLPTFVMPGGALFDLKRLGTELEIKAVKYAYRDDLAWALGLADTADKAGVDWTALEAALRERAAGGNLAKLVGDDGLLRYVWPGDANKVLLPPNFSRDKVAAAAIDPNRMRSDRPLTDAEKAKAPVAIRYKGKTVFYDGAEQLAAKFIRDRTDAAGALGDGVYVRFIDLDAPPPVKAQPLGESLTPEKREAVLSAVGKVLEDLGKGSASRKAQEGGRAALRDVLRASGILPRDGILERGYTPPKVVLFDDKHQEWDKLETNERALAATDAAADHDFNGKVRIRTGIAAKAHAALVKVQADPASATRLSSADVRELWGVSSLLHEEIHGASRITTGAYAGVGVGIEEAATEILARKLTREILGVKRPMMNWADTPFGLPQWDPKTGAYVSGPANGSYNSFIEGLFTETAKVTGRDKIHDRVEQALLKTRQGTEGDPEWASGEAQVRAYVDALGLSKAESDTLFAALKGPKSPLR